MTKFKMDNLFKLVKASVDNADLQTVLQLSGPRAPCRDEYLFESAEIAEHLCDSYLPEDADDAAKVSELALWLSDYWARQLQSAFDPEPAVMEPSVSFTGLAQELLTHRSAVATPAAEVEYRQCACGSTVGYQATNEELLALAGFWTEKIVDSEYTEWTQGGVCRSCLESATAGLSRLRQIAAVLGHAETHKAIKDALVAYGLEVDTRGFITWVHETPPFGTCSNFMNDLAEFVELTLCCSLYAEYLLIASESGDGWSDIGSRKDIGGSRKCPGPELVN